MDNSWKKLWGLRWDLFLNMRVSFLWLYVDGSEKGVKNESPQLSVNEHSGREQCIHAGCTWGKEKSIPYNGEGRHVQGQIW